MNKTTSKTQLSNYPVTQLPSHPITQLPIRPDKLRREKNASI